MANKKYYEVKVFDRNAQYIKTWNDVSIDSFFKVINGGLGELTLALPRAFDNFDEGISVAATNTIEVWVRDKDTTGKLLYSGYISGYRISIYEGTERVTVICLGFINIYSKLIYKNGTQVSLPHVAADPTTIAKDVVTRIRAEYSDDAIANKISYTTDSTELTGTSVDYTFDSYFGLHALERAIDLCPETFYFHIGADNVLYFKRYPSQPTHTFVFEQDFRSLEVFKNIESVTNNLLFWNGEPGIREAYIKFTAQTGIAGSSGNSYVYNQILAGAGRTIVAGDFFEYDVVWTELDTYMAASLRFSDLGYFHALTGVNDQNGLNNHPNVDISKYAYNKVYHRKFDMSAAIGRTIDKWGAGCERDSGIKTGYFANFKITNGGVTVVDGVSDTAPMTSFAEMIGPALGGLTREFSWNTIPPISSLYTNTESKNLYGYRFSKDSDNRITAQATADRWGTAYVTRNKNIEVQATVEILDNNITPGGYDIESIEPGQTCKLVNLPATTSSTFDDNMVIISVDYRPDAVILELGSAAALLEKKMTNIKRTLDNTDYEAGQPSYTQTLV